MKRLLRHTMLTAAFSALLGSFAPLVAQTRTELRANIPFAFHAQGRLLPAGAYEIDAQTVSGIFQISNRVAKEFQFLNAPVPSAYMPQKSVLIFQRYGNDYVLKEIAVAGAAHSYAVPPSAVEKNLTRSLGLAAMISIPLHAR